MHRFPGEFPKTGLNYSQAYLLRFRTHAGYEKEVFMSFDVSMDLYAQKLALQIAELEEQIVHMPEGRLQISRAGNYYNWKVVYPDKSRIYLPKKQILLAQALAKKNLCEAQLADLKEEQAACGKYIKYKSRSCSREERLLKQSGPEFIRLLGFDAKTKNERVTEWENSLYRKSEKFPELLKHPTLKDKEMVRSKFEADTARSLYLLNIPYRYEQIVRVGDVDVAIDFLALDVRNYREVALELFGMMDRPEYRRAHDRKLINYINNGYIPGINLLTFYESSNSPSNPMYIRQVLKDFFFNNPPIMI